MSENLKVELTDLDEKIAKKTEELKALKKARKKLAGALEQLNLL